MADFNTHGGYFAPAGYMKVNEGGTHEENPNGGVQIGVDPEGTPNMVEEGEPIYNDFVFSDNIKAQEKFLVEANVPKRYAGKLYSEIVDDLFAEAEERPNDPISKNGLESMLGRVAQAQEAQKAAEEEQALIEELQNMSPEELESLEQMLAQPQEEQMSVPEEAVPVEAAGMVPEEQVAPEEMMAPEMPAPQMMASGGPLKEAVSHFFNGPETWTAPDGKEYPIVNGMPPAVAGGAAKLFPKIAKGSRAMKNATEADKAAEAALTAYENVGKAAKRFPWKKVGIGLGIPAGIGLAEEAIRFGINTWGAPNIEGDSAELVEIDPNDFARGGKRRGLIGRALQNPARSVPGGLEGFNPFGLSYGPMYLLQDDERWSYSAPEKITLPEAFYSDNIENHSGYYRRPAGVYINPNTGLPIPFGKPQVSYLYDQEGLSSAPTNPASVAEDTAVGATTSTTATPAPIRRPTSTLPAGPAIPTLPVGMSDAQLSDIARFGTDAMLPANPAEIAPGEIIVNNKSGLRGPTVFSDTESGVSNRPKLLSTLPRYAGAIGSGLLALNNLLQKPDHYEDVPIRPVLPTGRILLQDERYMPLDQNMVTNQIQANNAANARAILNAGAGPSTGALLAAADYTGGLNLGNAMNQVWQANNQERNRVIAANNQNAATRAQFYRDLDSQRAQIMNNMAMLNRQNALRIAMLNNQAEQDKYNAFGQNLGNSLQALSGIGQENFAMNQLNTNSALGWYVGPDGRAYYRGPNWNKCGGLLKKAK